MGQFGEYTVDLISEEPLGGFTIRTLSILENKVSVYHVNRILMIIPTPIVSESSSSNPVSHHMLGIRWTMYQPKKCCGYH